MLFDKKWCRYIGNARAGRRLTRDLREWCHGINTKISMKQKTTLDEIPHQNAETLIGVKKWLSHVQWRLQAWTFGESSGGTSPSDQGTFPGPLPTELLELYHFCCFKILFLFPKTLKTDVWGVLLVRCCCFADKYLKDQWFPVSLDVHLCSCNNLYFKFTFKLQQEW